MIKRDGRGNLGSLSRGTERWLNQARFFLAAFQAILIVAVLSGISTIGIFSWKTMSDSKIDRNINGRLYQLEAVKSAWTKAFLLAVTPIYLYV